MRKIPTVFRRNPDDRKHVLAEVEPGCQWALTGEAIPTRKVDGTCVMFDGSQWWARREVKPGKAAPAGYVEVHLDEVTGKRMGWEPATSSSFAPWLAEAIAAEEADGGTLATGTYELLGPKVNGNPERREVHTLYRHADAEPLTALPGWPDLPLSYDGLRGFLATFDGEGIVWHHPDGRMAKLKRRDFPTPG